MKSLIVGTGKSADRGAQALCTLEGMTVHRAAAFAERPDQVIQQYMLIVAILEGHADLEELYRIRAAYAGNAGPRLLAVVGPALQGRLGEVLEQRTADGFAVAADELLITYRVMDWATDLRRSAALKVKEQQRIAAECLLPPVS